MFIINLDYIIVTKTKTADDNVVQLLKKLTNVPMKDDKIIEPVFLVPFKLVVMVKLTHLQLRKFTIFTSSIL